MCLNPVMLRKPSGDVYFVPCGHCLQCLKSYQDSWCARLNEEVKCWNTLNGQAPVIFFTLDYRPESVPCTYLSVSRYGVRLQDSRPDAFENYEFWTDTRRESRSGWLARRKEMLTRYWQYIKYNSVNLECNSHYKMSLPESFPVEFFRFSSGSLEHPKISLDIVKYNDVAIAPVQLCLEFHSVYKKDVQGWLKRCRKSLSFRYPDVFSIGQNPRQRTSFFYQGQEVPFPSSVLTASVKYFITSEYGPKTERPHYHGVMFGITYDEFKETFAKDWEARFGHCDFSVLRPSGGAMLYVAKYCSKGEYEHSYCKRDYFYKDTEYHSRHFEDSILDFGLDLPLVRPTFHLVSNGLGASYCYQNEVLSYVGVGICQYLTNSGKLRYASSENFSLSLPTKPLTDLINITYQGVPCSSCLDIFFDENNNLCISKYLDKDKKYLLSFSCISPDSVVDAVRQSLISSLKYTRTYVKEKKISDSVSLFWKQGLSPNYCKSEVVSCTTSISFPRYYKKILFPPLVSAFSQAAAMECPPNWHVQAARFVQSDGQKDSSNPSVLALRTAAEVSKEVVSSRLRRGASDFISRSKF